MSLSRHRANVNIAVDVAEPHSPIVLETEPGAPAWWAKPLAPSMLAPSLFVKTWLNLVEPATSPGVFSGPNSERLEALRLAIR
jgi:hypothetical protein